MRPNSKRHRPDPKYVRTLLDRICCRTNMDDEAVAERLGIHVRTIRKWYGSPEKDSYVPIPYVSQFALEELARS